MTSDIAIGRNTKQGPLTAYRVVDKRFGFLGILGCLIPAIIMPYYCAIGGWVIKYFVAFLTGDGMNAAQDGYFTGFITSEVSPVVYMVIFLAVVSGVIILGVNKGIESSSKIIMPILVVLVLGIAIFSLTISYTGDDGVVRTGMQGLKIYLGPDLKGLTFGKFFTVLVDAMGQLFFSLSVAMGIMIAYGSYVKDDSNLVKSINQIEIFDTGVAFLAGVMIIPAVFTFMGREGMEASGPSLMFVSLPKVFALMGVAGNVIGCMFFAMVLFAAVTIAISIEEAVVSSLMDKFHLKRLHATLLETAIALVFGLIVCLGYNKLYFEVTLPNGAVAQILDIMDYISNNVLMPMISIGTCILIGWVKGPQFIIDEAEKNGEKFGRAKLYSVMMKYIAPVMLFILFLKSIGILNIFD